MTALKNNAATDCSRDGVKNHLAEVPVNIVTASDGLDKTAKACAAIPVLVLDTIGEIYAIGAGEPLDPISAALLELSLKSLDHAVDLLHAELDRSETAYLASLDEDHARLELGLSEMAA